MTNQLKMFGFTSTIIFMMSFLGILNPTQCLAVFLFNTGLYMWEIRSDGQSLFSFATIGTLSGLTIDSLITEKFGFLIGFAILSTISLISSTPTSSFEPIKKSK